MFCCISNIGLARYSFTTMDPVSQKPNLMVTCATIKHVRTRPCLPHTSPKAAVCNLSHIKRESQCTTKEVPVEREEEMKRPGHSWPEPGQTPISLLTLWALVTLSMDTLWCCAHLALVFKSNISMCHWIYLSEKLMTSLGAHGDSMDLQKLRYQENNNKK